MIRGRNAAILGAVVAALAIAAGRLDGIGRAVVALVALIGFGLVDWATGRLSARKQFSFGRRGAKLLGKIVRSQAKTRRKTPAVRPAGSRSQREAWRKLVAEASSTAENGISILQVGQVAAALGIAPRLRLTPRQSANLVQTADDAGFAVEPDKRIDERTYAWDSLIAVYPSRPGSGPPLDPRERGAALILGLGISIARADGAVDRTEIDHVATFLEAHFRLGSDQSRRLEACKRLYLQGPPPNPFRLGKLLRDHLPPTELEKIGPILVEVAALDDRIDQKERNALRAAYRALGLDPSSLDRLLETLLPAPTPTAQPIAAEPETSVVIDPERLNRVLGETRDVARILGEAMRDDDEPVAILPRTSVAVTAPTPTRRIPEPVGADRRFEALDPRYHAMVDELTKLADWSQQDFETLARRHHTMPANALEAVNEWSQDRFGDLLLESAGERMYVHAGLLKNDSPNLR